MVARKLNCTITNSERLFWPKGRIEHKNYKAFDVENVYKLRMFV